MWQKTASSLNSQLIHGRWTLWTILVKRISLETLNKVQREAILYFNSLRNILYFHISKIIYRHVLRPIPYLAYFACTWPICFLFKFYYLAKYSLDAHSTTNLCIYSYTNAGTRTHKFAIQNTNHHTAQTNILYVIYFCSREIAYSDIVLLSL